MSLQTTEVRSPCTAFWIEMQNLRIFKAIISSLPGVHGTLVAVFARILSGRIKPAIAVQKKCL